MSAFVDECRIYTLSFFAFRNYAPTPILTLPPSVVGARGAHL